MKKFIIRWNAGYGDSYEIVEASNKDCAIDMASHEWREEAESNADYDAEEYTEELAEDYGLE